MSSSREQLLGYLLGALEPAEMAAVERDLESRPELRRDLEKMEACLAPLNFPDREDEFELDGPPTGLVERTCEFVEECRESVRPRATKIAPVVRYEGPSEVRRRMSWADLAVAASVILAAGALLFPAIASSRQSAQVNLCQDNLRQLGTSLTVQANNSPNKRYLGVAMRGNRAAAGVYAPKLQAAGHLANSKLVICPSSELGKEVGEFHLPTLAELDQATGEALSRIQKVMGGSYAYNMGFIEQGELKSPKWEGRSHYAVMSDAPSVFRPERKSKNHGGRGQNILYEDNRVTFVVNLADDLMDDPYLNRSGLVAAGEDCTDVVLGESIARPMPSVLMSPMGE